MRAGGTHNWTGSPDQKAEVVAAYKAGESIRRLAERLHVSARYIIAALDEADVPRRHQGKTPLLGEDTVDQLVAGYADGLTLPQLAARFGIGNHVTVRSYLVRRGVELRPPGVSRFWTDERRREAVRRYAGGESQKQIATSLGCSQGALSNVLREAGVVTRGPVRKGRDHPSWNGGRSITGEGYVRVKRDPADAHLITPSSNGYVLEHRLVMARKLGRPLKRSETVHHKNGDKADNAEGNLQLRSGQHGTGVAAVCLDCGSRNVGHTDL